MLDVDSLGGTEGEDGGSVCLGDGGEDVDGSGNGCVKAANCLDCGVEYVGGMASYNIWGLNCGRGAVASTGL